MSVGFYMDVNVPYAITKALRFRGVDVLISQEDGTREFEDAALLDRATELQRIFFTQDGDLLREAALRQRSGGNFAGLIYTHQENVTTSQCIDDLELIAKATEPEEWSNRVQYLPLR